MSKKIYFLIGKLLYNISRTSNKMTTEKCVVTIALKNTLGLEEMSIGMPYSSVPSHPMNLVNV